MYRDFELNQYTNVVNTVEEQCPGGEAVTESFASHRDNLVKPHKSPLIPFIFSFYIQTNILYEYILFI